MKQLIYKFSAQFGILLGIASFLFFLALYASKVVELYFKMADIGIIVILIWASIWYFKRNNGGELHFYQAFSVGILTNIIGAVVSGVLVFLFIEFVDNQPFVDWIVNCKQTLLANKNGDLKNVFSESDFNNQLLAFDNMKPISIIFDSLFKNTLIGIVPIVLLSMVMRKISKCNE